MKEYLHKKYGWFKCRFHPFDVYYLKHEGDKIKCRWCNTEWNTEGYPYLDCKLTLNK